MRHDPIFVPTRENAQLTLLVEHMKPMKYSKKKVGRPGVFPTTFSRLCCSWYQQLSRCDGGPNVNSRKQRIHGGWPCAMKLFCRNRAMQRQVDIEAGQPAHEIVAACQVSSIGTPQRYQHWTYITFRITAHVCLMNTRNPHQPYSRVCRLLCRSNGLFFASNIRAPPLNAGSKLSYQQVLTGH